MFKRIKLQSRKIMLSKRAWRLVFGPACWFVLFYFIMIRTLANGSFVEAFSQTWGVAILTMLISYFYVEFLFTTPKDGFINSLNALLISFVWFNLLGFRTNFWIALAYSLVGVIFGLLFLIFYKSDNKSINFIKKIPTIFGRAQHIFPVIVVLDFIKFDNNWLMWKWEDGIVYFLFFYFLFRIFLWLTTKNSFSELFKKLLKVYRFGIIKANLTPNVVLCEFKSNDKVKINDLIYLGEDDFTSKVQEDDFKFIELQKNKFGLVLDFIGAQSEDNNIVARVYLLNEPQKNLDENNSGVIKVGNECFKINKPDKLISKIESEKIAYIWKRKRHIIGLVAPNSNIDTLKSEIIRHQEIENAEFISVIGVNNHEICLVRYQIIEELTQREGGEEKKDFGYTQLIAHQLGEWRKPLDENGQERPTEFHRFFDFQKVPALNSLVFRWNERYDEANISDDDLDLSEYFKLGNIPKTNLPIYLGTKELVSHHSSILGVTGSGKSTLVLKMLDTINSSDNCLIICIDITGEYEDRLTEFEKFTNQKIEKQWILIVNKIEQARKDSQASKFPAPSRYITHEELISVENECTEEINNIIFERIDELREVNKKIIFELNNISNTESSIECTQYIIRGVLEYAKRVYKENLSKEDDDKDDFQCCLVLEEAHTLIPENLGVGGDYGASKATIDNISQIALQGRKYNVGFLLISQRTATVKKTVLNQSNTIISFRAYDETSFKFLASYFGEDYVKEIIHLKNDGDSRYVLVAGKAVVADRPVIVEVKK